MNMTITRNRCLLACTFLFWLGVLAVLGSPLSFGQQLIWSWDGEPGGYSAGNLGFAVASAGDVDGDGYQDVVASSPLFTSGLSIGRVYIYSGRTGLLIRSSDGGTVYNPGDGSYHSDYGYGLAVSDAGDANHDGFGDYIIGIPQHYRYAYMYPFGYQPQYSVGAATVISGFDGSTWFSVSGIAPGDALGIAVTGLGDITGDGCDDVAFGANGVDQGGTNDGAVYLLSGKDGSSIVNFYGSSDQLGSSLCGAGDVDGDGKPDLVVGAPASSSSHSRGGRAKVFSGRTYSVLYDLVGEVDNAYFGQEVAGGGDMDGDGLSDFGILASQGAGSTGSYGRVYLYSGMTGTVIRTFDGDPSMAISKISMRADLDLDGHSDLVVGGTDTTTGLGKILIQSGANGSSLYIINGSTPNDYFGSSLACVGDVDGNGIPDVSVGATNSSPNGNCSVFEGSSPSEISQVIPSRGRHTDSTSITISGARFSWGADPSVTIGGVAASDVVIVDDSTITCTAGPGQPGPADVVVQNSIGSGSLAGGFTYSPAVIVDGDPSPGSHVTVRYLCDAADGLFAILGVPPAVSIPTPPFEGNDCIFPFQILFIIPPGSWPFNEFDLGGDVPNDPSLSGAQILLQALIGPSFSGKNKDAIWTNCWTMTIQ